MGSPDVSVSLSTGDRELSRDQPVSTLLREEVFSSWGQDEDRLATVEEPRARRASEATLAAAALIYPGWHWIFTSVMPTG